jgi:hypothetical protein
MQITTEAKAFLEKKSGVTPADLRTEEGARRLSFFRADMSAYGFLYIGKATITVEIPDEKELVENAVASLREQAAHIRAKATAECTEIEGQIQQLLAITYQPATEGDHE